jgi:hypothetical protein
MNRVALLALLLVAGCAGSSPPPEPAAPAEPVADEQCRAQRVHHTPYPGGDERLYTIPWIAGKPDELGLVGLLWYWPKQWRGVRRARVFTGDVGPDGQSAKILWAFLEPGVFDRAEGELVIEGENLDGSARFREEFAPISYAGQEGAPSWASSLDLPTPGCWRLTLTTGDLDATVDIRAVDQGLAATSANSTGSSSPSTRSR